MNTLILIPTDLERQRLLGSLRDALAPDDRIELCGFGPIAAAARTATLLATVQPARALLVGIAGALDPRLEPGCAAAFSAVACYGVGAGTGSAFLPAAEMGWPQWPGDPPEDAAAIGDVLPCAFPAAASAAQPSRLLLTACAASASPDDVTLRRRLFPDAVAEDMEGFGVAAACRMTGVPLTIIRGISNRAGNRDVATWQIPQALTAAGDVAARLLSGL